MQVGQEQRVNLKVGNDLCGSPKEITSIFVSFILYKIFMLMEIILISFRFSRGINASLKATYYYVILGHL